VIDLIDMKAYAYEGESTDNCKEIPIPDELQAQAEEYREKLMDEVAEVSDALMERYLEGEEISHEEIVQALKTASPTARSSRSRAASPPRTWRPTGCSTRSSRTCRRRSRRAPSHAGDRDIEAEDEGDAIAFVFKTLADPFAGKINLMRVYHGVVRADSPALQHTRARQGTDGPAARATGQGDGSHRGARTRATSGRVAKLKEDARRRRAVLEGRGSADRAAQAAGARHGVRHRAEAQGRRGQGLTAPARLQEEDPTIDVHRDDQTGEQIVAGLTQIHVEVIVDRMKERYGAEVTLKPPRVPYRETIKGTAKAHGRYKKQTGGRGQFGDCHIEIEPIAGEPTGFEFENKIKGGVIPSGFIPPSRRAFARRWTRASWPATRCAA
jgi:elongation factor G